MTSRVAMPPHAAVDRRVPRRRLLALLLVVARSTVPADAFRAAPARRAAQRGARPPMGPHDEDIDWDADPFEQVGTPNTTQFPHEGRRSENENEPAAWGDDAWDWDTGPPSNSSDARLASEQASGSDPWGDDAWDMGPPSNANDDVQAMRRRMGASWGGGEKEGGEKPTADWMPGFRTGPDEEEPWFTG